MRQIKKPVKVKKKFSWRLSNRTRGFMCHTEVKDKPGWYIIFSVNEIDKYGILGINSENVDALSSTDGNFQYLVLPADYIISPYVPYDYQIQEARERCAIKEII